MQNAFLSLSIIVAARKTILQGYAGFFSQDINYYFNKYMVTKTHCADEQSNKSVEDKDRTPWSVRLGTGYEDYQQLNHVSLTV